MKKLIVTLLLFMGMATINNIYGQVSKAAVITNSDFRPGMQLMGGVGINFNASGFSGMSYIGFEGLFSIGSFGNRVNLEFVARPCFQIDDPEGYGVDIGFICPLTIAPRLNICRVAKNNFYMYIQPEGGYAINAGLVYGGRFGLGFRGLGSLYLDTLSCSNVMGEGTNFASNWLFLSFGYSLHFW